jgi:hypothetical protein
VPGLLLPRSYVAEQGAARLNAEIDAQVEEAKILSEDLKRIDSTLSVVWVGERVDDPELVPARWHIRRQTPGMVAAYIPLVGPDGEYREPGSWVLDWLQANDLWNPEVHRSREEAKQRHREAKVRAKRREEEQRKDEMMVAARATKRIRGDSGMTHRTDLKVPANIAAERKAKREAEQREAGQ